MPRLERLDLPPRWRREGCLLGRRLAAGGLSLLAGVTLSIWLFVVARSIVRVASFGWSLVGRGRGRRRILGSGRLVSGRLGVGVSRRLLGESGNGDEQGGAESGDGEGRRRGARGALQFADAHEGPPLTGESLARQIVPASERRGSLLCRGGRSPQRRSGSVIPSAAE